MPDEEHATTYRRTAHAEAVCDILRTVEERGAPVRLEGRGAAGPWCLLAAAISPRVSRIDADLRGFDPRSDQAWNRALNIPAIRQLGGLEAMLAAIGPRRGTLRGLEAG